MVWRDPVVLYDLRNFQVPEGLQKYFGGILFTIILPCYALAGRLAVDVEDLASPLKSSHSCAGTNSRESCCSNPGALGAGLSQWSLNGHPVLLEGKGCLLK